MRVRDAEESLRAYLAQVCGAPIVYSELEPATAGVYGILRLRERTEGQVLAAILLRYDLEFRAPDSLPDTQRRALLENLAYQILHTENYAFRVQYPALDYKVTLDTLDNDTLRMTIDLELQYGTGN